MFILNHQGIFNSLPNDKILNYFKFKAYADDEIDVTQKMEFILGRVENIVGKGENAGIFSSFLTMFSKILFFMVIKTQDLVIESEQLQLAFLDSVN